MRQPLAGHVDCGQRTANRVGLAPRVQCILFAGLRRIEHREDFDFFAQRRERGEIDGSFLGYRRMVGGEQGQRRAIGGYLKKRGELTLVEMA